MLQPSGTNCRPNAIAKVQIAEDVELTLPLMPGYPQDALLFQTLVGRYDGRTRAFQATLSLSPARSYACAASLYSFDFSLALAYSECNLGV